MVFHRLPVAAFCATATALFTVGGAAAGTFSTITLASDSDLEAFLLPGEVTHAVDMEGPGATLGNGVVFTASSSGVGNFGPVSVFSEDVTTGADFSFESGQYADPTVGTVPRGVAAGSVLDSITQNFVCCGGGHTITINDLTPGLSHVFTLIDPIFGANVRALTVTIGADVLNIDQDSAVEAIQYEYIADATGTLVIDISGSSPHGYAFTNHKLPPTEVLLDSDTADGLGAVGDEIGILSTRGGSPPFTYTLVAGAGDDDNALFMIAADEFQTASSLAGLIGEVLSVRVRSTDGNADQVESILTLTVLGDTDNDGLPDFWEEIFAPGNLNTLSGLGGADADSDGASDLDEYNLNPDGSGLLSPVVADSDGDGSDDGDEINNNTDPEDSDTDDDGLTDGEEATALTNPLLPDSDGDGRSDFEELNTAPLTDPNDEDSDGDSAADGLEVGLGSDPNDASDTPLLGVFTDTFSRDDSLDINASTGGQGGSAAPLGYLTKATTEIAGQQLKIAGGSGFAVPNHDFIDAELNDGFRIRLQMNPFIGGDGSQPQWGAISLGHTLDSASTGNFRLLSPDAAFAILLREDGRISSFTNGTTIVNGPVYETAPGGDETYPVDIIVSNSGFTGAATVRVLVAGVPMEIDTDATPLELEITLAGTNYLNLETNVGAGSCFDNLQVLPNVPLSVSLQTAGVSAAAAVGSTAGTLLTDGGAPAFSYALVAGSGDDDNARFSISGDSLQVAASLADAAGGSLSIRVRSTDQNAVSTESIIQISVQGDSDSDLLPDAWEAIFAPGNLATLSGLGGADSDNDGLSDLEEFNANPDGSSPLSPVVADSDGDSVQDGAEVTAGTDPIDSDSDDDGLNDGDEITAGTDALNPDSDADGLADGFEVTSPLGIDPNLADTDSDGVSDSVEVGLGSNPSSAGDVPETGIFTDTFNRLDSMDSNATNGGIAESIGFTGYAATSDAISGMQLITTGGAGRQVIDHDFLDPALEDGFTIAFDVDPVIGGDGSANQWGAVMFGMSRASATMGNFRIVNGDASYGILLRDNGALSSFANGSLLTDATIFNSAPDGSETYHVEVEVLTDGFTIGTTATVRVRIDGMLQDIGGPVVATEAEVTWQGPNYIMLESNAGAAGTAFDNLQIIPSGGTFVTEPEITAIGFNPATREVNLDLSYQPGEFYELQISTDLRVWSEFDDSAGGDPSGASSYSTIIPAGQDSFFFRLKEL